MPRLLPPGAAGRAPQRGIQASLRGVGVLEAPRENGISRVSPRSCWGWGWPPGRKPGGNPALLLRAEQPGASDCSLRGLVSSSEDGQ